MQKCIIVSNVINYVCNKLFNFSSMSNDFNVMQITALSCIVSIIYYFKSLKVYFVKNAFSFIACNKFTLLSGFKIHWFCAIWFHAQSTQLLFNFPHFIDWSKTKCGAKSALQKLLEKPENFVFGLETAYFRESKILILLLW